MGVHETEGRGWGTRGRGEAGPRRSQASVIRHEEAASPGWRARSLPAPATQGLQTPPAFTPGGPRPLVTQRKLSASRCVASGAGCILEDVLTSRREEADASQEVTDLSRLDTTVSPFQEEAGTRQSEQSQKVFGRWDGQDVVSCCCRNGIMRSSRND